MGVRVLVYMWPSSTHSVLTLLRAIGSAGAGLGLLWIAISLIRIAKSFPPPKPFAYGRFTLSILPTSVMLLCGSVRLFVDEGDQWLTTIVIISIALTCICSFGAAIHLHKNVHILIQVNKDLTRLGQVVSHVVDEVSGSDTTPTLLSTLPPPLESGASSLLSLSPPKDPSS